MQRLHQLIQWWGPDTIWDSIVHKKPITIVNHYRLCPSPIMKSVVSKALLALLFVGLLIVARTIYMTPNYQQGEQALHSRRHVVEWRDFSLSDVKGKYTLVHFWGSWCGPCRVENPNLRQLWLKYKDKSNNKVKGFEIVSIAIERKKGDAVGHKTRSIVLAVPSD